MAAPPSSHTTSSALFDSPSNDPHAAPLPAGLIRGIIAMIQNDPTLQWKYSEFLNADEIIRAISTNKRLAAAAPQMLFRLAMEFSNDPGTGATEFVSDPWTRVTYLTKVELSKKSKDDRKRQAARVASMTGSLMPFFLPLSDGFVRHPQILTDPRSNRVRPALVESRLPRLSEAESAMSNLLPHASTHSGSVGAPLDIIDPIIHEEEIPPTIAFPSESIPLECFTNPTKVVWMGFLYWRSSKIRISNDVVNRILYYLIFDNPCPNFEACAFRVNRDFSVPEGVAREMARMSNLVTKVDVKHVELVFRWYQDQRYHEHNVSDPFATKPTFKFTWWLPTSVWISEKGWTGGSAREQIEPRDQFGPISATNWIERLSDRLVELDDVPEGIACVQTISFLDQGPFIPLHLVVEVIAIYEERRIQEASDVLAMLESDLSIDDDIEQKLTSDHVGLILTWWKKEQKHFQSATYRSDYSAPLRSNSAKAVQVIRWRALNGPRSIKQNVMMTWNRTMKTMSRSRN
ncbi:MAG: hypothetical protein M1837_007213 [Sclerophora amabilis]|nr:MAG: hypothetical protein M1837_007213 [Sclerophora amabilis]